MDIKTLYDINDKVNILRTIHLPQECECCGNMEATKKIEEVEVAKIERIEIYPKNRICYVVRFINNNGGAMTVYDESDIIERVK
ncbi:MAG: hypothetical protein COB61_011550 [Thiotrichales bacterium]|nr:hypothetical protein [Thiotrichales bacterium]